MRCEWDFIFMEMEVEEDVSRMLAGLAAAAARANVEPLIWILRPFGCGAWQRVRLMIMEGGRRRTSWMRTTEVRCWEVVSPTHRNGSAVALQESCEVVMFSSCVEASVWSSSTPNKCRKETSLHGLHLSLLADFSSSHLDHVSLYMYLSVPRYPYVLLHNTQNSPCLSGGVYTPSQHARPWPSAR